MNIEIIKENGNTEIILNTRLDSSTAPEFDTVLQKEIDDVRDSLTVNLKNVDFISSIGLRVLVSGYKKLNGKEFILKNANDSVKEVLDLSGLTKLFKII